MDIDISHVLINALSADAVTRKTAEKTLENLAYTDFGVFLLRLANELATETRDVKVRQMAATIIKNCLVYSSQLREKWNAMDAEVKHNIKSTILSSLASSNKLIRKITGSTIAGICRVEQPLITQWPEIINSLCTNSYHTDINIKLSALQTIGFICEELTLKSITSDAVDQILSALITNINDNLTNQDIVTICLSSLVTCIPLCTKNFASEGERDIIMKCIINTGNSYANNDDILEILAKIFIVMADTYYENIDDYMDQLSEFSFYIIKNKEEKLAMLAFEFWCSIGEEEKKKLELQLNQAKVKRSKNSFQKYFAVLFQLLLRNIENVSSDDYESDDWSLVKVSQYVLSLGSQLIDTEMLNLIISYIENNISSGELIKEHSALLVMYSVLDTNHKIRISELAISLFGRLFKFLSSNNIYIQKCTTLVLMKISKNFGKLIDPNKLIHLIPQLINLLTTGDNKLGINVCNIFTYLIKAHGDLDTNKSTNQFSHYFETVFQTLLNVSMRNTATQKNENLCMYCFLAINHLIEYSSHDKQLKLSEIIIYFLGEFEKLYNPEYVRSMNWEGNHVLDLQAYYCNVFRTCVNKMLNKMNLELAERLLNTITNSFNLRKAVYDEGMLVICALATRESITPFFQNYYKFIEHSFTLYNESTLLKSAVLCLQDSVRGVGLDFRTYGDTFIPLLVGLLRNSDVNRNVKTLCIASLGQICLSINQYFLQYLAPVMDLLLSAAHMATTRQDDEDEDFEEYILELRLELFEAFTLIAFGLDDCGQKDLFVQYVPTIIAFAKTITSNDYSIRHEILKSIICFISDMVSSYGRNMATLVDKNFLDHLSSRYRSVKKGKLDDSVIQSEKVIFLT